MAISKWKYVSQKVTKTIHALKSTPVMVVQVSITPPIIHPVLLSITGSVYCHHGCPSFSSGISAWWLGVPKMNLFQHLIPWRHFKIHKSPPGMFIQRSAQKTKITCLHNKGSIRVRL